MADEPRLIPPENWIQHPVSDHGDLDRPEPSYGEGLSGDAKAEYDAAVAAQKPKDEPKVEPKPKARRRRRGKRS